jgi:predicted DNA binding protein
MPAYAGREYAAVETMRNDDETFFAADGEDGMFVAVFVFGRLKANIRRAVERRRAREGWEGGKSHGVFPCCAYYKECDCYKMASHGTTVHEVVPLGVTVVGGCAVEARRRAMHLVPAGNHTSCMRRHNNNT